MRPSFKSIIGVSLLALLLVVGAFTPRPGSPRSHTHSYYIAADEITWDYAPSGLDQVKGQAFDAIERPYIEAGPNWVGKVTLKAVYREYTDSSFGTLKPRAAAWAHMGFLGPLL